MAETFGKTDKGETQYSDSGNRVFGCKFQSGSAGSLQSISLYIKNVTGSQKIKCAIYDSDLNILANGVTEEKVSEWPDDHWLTLNFLIPPTIQASTDYWLCAWHELSLYMYREDGSVDQFFLDAQTYDSWPDTLSPDAYYAYEFSIFATYEEVNNAPTAPTALQVDGQSDPTGANCISSANPGFTAIYNDPDAGDQSNAIQIQVGTASGLSDMWDSGWLADSTVESNRCAAKSYDGAALSKGTSYWWRCRFRDDENAEGAWSEWQQFDMCVAAVATLVQMVNI